MLLYCVYVIYPNLFELLNPPYPTPVISEPDTEYTISLKAYNSYGSGPAILKVATTNADERK